MSAAALTLDPPVLAAIAPEPPAPFPHSQERQEPCSEHHKETPAPLVERSVLRQRAFALYCQGLRSPAIATRLGVPQCTVRFWIAAIPADAQADVPLPTRTSSRTPSKVCASFSPPPGRRSTATSP